MPGVALKEEVPGETGADRDWGTETGAETGTETGAQRLAQTETGADSISGDLLSFLIFAKSAYKAEIAQVVWCGGQQEGIARTPPSRTRPQWCQG